MKALLCKQFGKPDTLILEELEDENRWDESFAHSPDLLTQLAAEAMAEHRASTKIIEQSVN